MASGGQEATRRASDPIKPRLRGWLHAGAAPVVLAAGLVLVAVAAPGVPRVVAVVYAVCGLLLFATSGLYHRGSWSPRAQGRLRRIDHSNVYLLIAGTYTPVVTLALTGATRVILLWMIWVGATVGVLFRWLWPDAPRALYTALYIALGWSFAPAFGSLIRSAGMAVFILTLAGGLLYTAGAAVYAGRRPDPSPTWFGFHEIFHSLTIAAWACQYLAISLLVYRTG